MWGKTGDFVGRRKLHGATRKLVLGLSLSGYFDWFSPTLDFTFLLITPSRCPPASVVSKPVPELSTNPDGMTDPMSGLAMYCARNPKIIAKMEAPSEVGRVNWVRWRKKHILRKASFIIWLKWLKGIMPERVFFLLQMQVSCTVVLWKGHVCSSRNFRMQH